jgi:anti-anti-sigma regulatory factor
LAEKRVGGESMALRVTERKVADDVILDLEGKVFLDSCRAAEEAVKLLLAKGEKRILLNYRKAQIWDSAGWGQIILSFTRSGKAGAYLKLLSPSDRMLEQMRKIGIDKHIEWFSDEADAVSSFKS